MNPPRHRRAPSRTRRNRIATVLVAAAVTGGAVGVATASRHSGAPPAADLPDAAPPASKAPPAPEAPPAGASAAASPSPTPSPTRRSGFAPSLAQDGASGPAAPPASPPVSVSIPAIGVESPLVQLSVAADGSLQVPGHDQFDEAGWLTTGPVPGQPGPAVIAGHVDSTSGPAVFYRLRELHAGDEVDVHRADGTTATFTVDSLQEVGKRSFPTQAVYGPQPVPVLRLITCGGTFDRSTGHYTDNIIAYAS